MLGGLGQDGGVGRLWAHTRLWTHHNHNSVQSNILWEPPGDQLNREFPITTKNKPCPVGGSLQRREGSGPTTGFPVWGTCVGRRPPLPLALKTSRHCVRERKAVGDRMMLLTNLHTNQHTWSSSMQAAVWGSPGGRGIKSTNLKVKSGKALSLETEALARHNSFLLLCSLGTGWCQISPLNWLTLFSLPLNPLKALPTCTLTRASPRWRQSCRTWWLASACSFIPKQPQAQYKWRPAWACTVASYCQAG